MAELSNAVTIMNNMFEQGAKDEFKITSTLRVIALALVEQNEILARQAEAFNGIAHVLPSIAKRV